MKEAELLAKERFVVLARLSTVPPLDTLHTPELDADKWVLDLKDFKGMGLPLCQPGDLRENMRSAILMGVAWCFSLLARLVTRAAAARQAPATASVETWK